MRRISRRRTLAVQEQVKGNEELILFCSGTPEKKQKKHKYDSCSSGGALWWLPAGFSFSSLSRRMIGCSLPPPNQRQAGRVECPKDVICSLARSGEAAAFSKLMPMIVLFTMIHTWATVLEGSNYSRFVRVTNCTLIILQETFFFWRAEKLQVFAGPPYSNLTESKMTCCALSVSGGNLLYYV